MSALGKYDRVSSILIERDLVGAHGYALGSDPKVFDFPKGITRKAIAKAMETEGYKPANIWDLLDYGAKNPDEQRKYPIMALGALVEVYDGQFAYFFVILLDIHGLQRCLETNYVNIPLEESQTDCTHQLGVRK